MENKFYITKYYLLIYETMNQAMVGYDSTAADYTEIRPASLNVASAVAIEMSKIVKGTVQYSVPEDVIFLLKRVLNPYADTVKYEFWHVIIGEKVGWIIVKDWIRMEEINGPEKNNVLCNKT